jgi:hypothetical protein
MLTRLPFELVQADNYVIFDDFLRVSPPRQQIQYIASALSSGTSLSTKAVFVPDRPIRIQDVQIFPDGSSSGISNSATSVWTVSNGSNTVATQTYNSTTAFPSSHTLTSLGAPANAVVPTGTGVFLAVTNGSGASTPATILQIGYTDLSAVSNWAVSLPNNGNAVVSDGLAGILTLTPSGSSPTASDEAYIYSPQQVFQPSAGYPLYLEALIQYTEANVNQAGVFFGWPRASPPARSSPAAPGASAPAARWWGFTRSPAPTCGPRSARTAPTSSPPPAPARPEPRRIRSSTSRSST